MYCKEVSGPVGHLLLLRFEDFWSASDFNLSTCTSSWQWVWSWWPSFTHLKRPFFQVRRHNWVIYQHVNSIGRQEILRDILFSTFSKFIMMDIWYLISFIFKNELVKLNNTTLIQNSILQKQFWKTANFIYLCWILGFLQPDMFLI